jgi:tetratricopeptide (TPR) repeat protein
MAKRIILVSSFPLIAAIAVIAIVLAGECLAETSSGIEQAKQNVISLIDARDFAGAKLAVTKLAADFSDDANLRGVLFLFTEKYESVQRFEDAKRVYQQILQKYPDSSYARLGISREEAMSLIASQDYDGAQKAIDKITADFAKNTDLQNTLYWIAEKYRWAKRFEDAKLVYQRVIPIQPDSPWAEKAKLGVSGVEVMSLIASQDYNDAQKAIVKITFDFAGNADLQGTLYWIAERYRLSKRFDDAKRVYQQVIQNQPSSPWADKAKFGVSRSEVMSLIAAESYDYAKGAIDKMVSDFSGNTDLPESLYSIAEKYKWAKRFDDANGFYQQAAQSQPGSPWADKATLGAYGAQVLSLIVSQDYDGAQKAIDRMTAYFAKDTDYFAKNTDLQDTLCWIADRYGWSIRFDDAKRIYQQALQIQQGGPYANRAKLGIARADIISLITSGECNEASNALNKMMVDFAGSSNLPGTLYQIAERYYSRASNSEKQGLNDQAKEYYEGAIAVWEKIITQLPASASYTPQACYSAAYCCFENTGEYGKAIEFCQTVIINWPGYKYACDLQFLLGNYYERMVQAGLISESEANPIIEEAYLAVVEKYSNCDKFKNASLKVAEMNFKKEQWEKAASYYELLLTKFPEGQRPASVLYNLGQAYDNMGKKDETIKIYNEFLLKANLGDPRIENIKQRIEKLRSSAKAKGILSDTILSSIYGGCICAGPPGGFPGMCIVISNGGSCSYPTCNWVGGCDCGASPTWCHDEPAIGPCTDGSMGCGSCTPSVCYISVPAESCVTRLAGVPSYCSGSYPQCH